MKRATDEGEKTYFRTERLFMSDGQYWFATREGIDQGPFATVGDAEAALRHYIQTQRTMERMRSRMRGATDTTLTHDDVAHIARTIRTSKNGRTDDD